MLRMMQRLVKGSGLSCAPSTATPVCLGKHIPRNFLYNRFCRNNAQSSKLDVRHKCAVGLVAATGCATAGVVAATAAVQSPSRKLLLVDGHNMAFKAYWGLMNRPGAAFRTSDGIPTTVAFGFLRSLMALLEQERPDALIVAFDAPVKSFRHEMLPTYKSQRAKAPPEFSADLRNLQQLLRFLRIHTLTAPGFEADDVLAGACRQASEAGYTVRVYSTDQDLWQVVDDAGRVGVLLPATLPKGARKGAPVATLVDEQAVRDRLGVAPAQVPDFKALVGDSSDNLPGIPGIGPKTAAQLLQRCGTVEGVFEAEAMMQHKDAVRNKLAGQQEAALMYKHLTVIRREAAPQLDFRLSHLQGFSESEVKPLLQRLEMTSLVKAIPHLQQLLGGPAPPSDLTAAVPAALAAFEASKSEAAVPVEQQSSAADPQQGDTTSTSNGSDVPAAVAATPEVPCVQRARSETGPVSLLPASLQARLPAMRIVHSNGQLQQLLSQLQQHKGSVTWSWPQSQLYTPASPPPLPSFICCTWDEAVYGQQPSAADVTPPQGAGEGSHQPPTVTAAAETTAQLAASGHSSARRHSSSSRGAAAAALSGQQQQQGQQQGQQVVGLSPQLAVLLLGQQLPGCEVLQALQPLLEDPRCTKVVFESKRCYTELKHWGVQLAGVDFDVLVGGCLLYPERWTEGKAKGPKVKALDPLQQQHQALPVMVHDVLNTTLLDLQAALQADYQQQQPTATRIVEGVAAAAAATAAADSSHSRSQTRSSSSLRRRSTFKNESNPAAQGGAPTETVVQQQQQQQQQEQQQQQQAVVAVAGSEELPGAAWHAAAEALSTHLLHGVFLQQLQQAGGCKMQALLKDVELPVQRVLSDMEVTGLGCNREAMLQQKADLQGEVSQLEARLFEIAGTRFNLSSRQQLSQVMYEELQLRPRDNSQSITTTAAGFKSTSLEEIFKLEPHPFITTYQDWNSLNTLLTKFYSDAYMNAINLDSGRVHTVLAPVGGATGRINSSHPNLQNIPQHMAGPQAAALRAAFNCPSPGHVLVSADYSQVELRVVAALAREQALLDAFAAGRDVHEATARVLLDKGPGEPVTPAERQMGKRINFCVLYGAGKDKVAQDAGVSPKEAKQFLDKFYAAYPGLFQYTTACQRSAVACGYTESFLGKRRLFSFHGEALRNLLGTKDLQSLPDMRQLAKMGNRADAQVLRQAGNAPIQGTSADILKVALIKLHSTLGVGPWHCRLLLTVHDSVVLEVPKAQWPAAREEIVAVMQGVLPELNLKVDIKEGW